MEILITIALVALLAAIAVPSYKDYTIRAQVEHSLTLAMPNQLLVESYLLETGCPTNAAGDTALNTSVKFVGANAGSIKTVQWTHFGVQIEQNFPALPAMHLMMIPHIVYQQVNWTCAYGPTTDPSNVKYMPKECQVAAPDMYTTKCL